MSLLSRRMMMMTNTENGGSEMAEWRLLGKKKILNTGERLKVSVDKPFTDMFIFSKMGCTKSDGKNFALFINGRVFCYIGTCVRKDVLNEYRVRIERIQDFLYVTWNTPASHQTGMQASNSYYTTCFKFTEPITEIDVIPMNDEAMVGSEAEIYAR